MDFTSYSKEELIRELNEVHNQLSEVKKNYELELKASGKIKEILKISEHRFRSTIECAPVGMHFYQIADGERLIFTGANKAANQLLGVDNKIFIGKTIEEAFPALVFTEVPERYRRAAVYGELWSTEQIEYDEGKIKGAFEVTAFQTEPNHMVAMFSDITVRRKAQEELKIFSEAIGESSAAVNILTAEGKQYYQNNAFFSLFGDVGEYPFDTLYVAKENGEVVLDAIKSGERWTGEVKMYSAGKRIIDVHLRAYSIKDEKGKIKVLVGVHNDISENKRFEQELLNAKIRAEESDRLKSAFLANMSHEIRTPMNGLLGFAELLKVPGLSSEDQTNYLQIIEASGKRMLNIINDIIDISKIEAGLVELQTGVSNINEQMEFVYNFFKPDAHKKGLDFKSNCGLADRNAYLLIDKEKIYAVLTNLVKNALKFTCQGYIHFGYVRKDNFLEFYVKDSGIGIPANRIEVVFDRFMQADIEDSRVYQGAGLGLTIAKAYIEMHGGKIWVESTQKTESKRGESNFYFTIPYIPQNAAIQTKKQEESELVLTTASRKLKILVAEDDSVSELLIEIALRDIDAEIINVSNGKEVVEICRNTKDIDLILMDLKMPEMTGFEAAREIRKFNESVIIIAQSAYGLQQDREKALAAGCTDYISKPIQKSKLLMLIEKYI